MALLPVEEALSRLLSDVTPGSAESVTLAQAAGRVLAFPVAALRTQPPFPASAMDGYAVRAADVATVPVMLRLIGEAPAGHQFDGSVGPGEAVRIFTGAPVPPGADTILIQENARRFDSGTVEAVETVAAGRHIRKPGLDFETGDPLLDAGRKLDPAALSLAAAANHAQLDVIKAPLVAIIATGDELQPPGSQNVRPDQIIASNGFGVAAIAMDCGARVLDLGIVQDDAEKIAAAYHRALTAGADVVVTLGGASVGDHDLIHDVLTSQGMTLDFWKIAMRPGKPLMFGRHGTVRIIGLPGNPVASLVCSHLFLKPLLLKLGGLPHEPGLQSAVLATPMAANDQRQDYVRAIISEQDGTKVATPFALQDSSMLKTLAAANALIVRPPHAPAAPVGETCPVLMLR
ncbi:molybdopterin molybdenumtransferase MoeA [Mesorhizobium sp. NBSH29]|uniref:molybdopterin molybdotransferase MoeA n=1 Tax=Mesorhizobium sp. NBSH29 TaxID=2654249 RepID=UPI0018965F35|nr:gephyrin-like molybdotransferase Glp [Mesorhizobium sp. NBSH29]QPC87781.1 molybdopterin molybdenumtransferase MoeA [Mesorhizobium sp. NBSH29]